MLDEIVDNRYLGGDTEGRGYDDYTTTTEHLTSSKTHPPYEYSEAEFKCHLDQTLNNQHFVGTMIAVLCPSRGQKELFEWCT